MEGFFKIFATLTHEWQEINVTLSIPLFDHGVTLSSKQEECLSSEE